MCEGIFTVLHLRGSRGTGAARIGDEGPIVGSDKTREQLNQAFGLLILKVTNDRRGYGSIVSHEMNAI